ncbi:MAG: acetolactate synthase small subunit [Candidatus Odinarchaeia archaeon]
MNTYIFSILVDDEPGVMHRVVSIFSRRAVNISRISVGPSEISPKIARIILSFDADPKTAKFMKNLLSKLISVKRITQFKSDRAVIRELAVIRLKSSQPNVIELVKNLIKESHTRLVDDIKGTAIELVGPIEEINKVVESLDHKYILEIVRSGIIALKK